MSVRQKFYSDLSKLMHLSVRQIAKEIGVDPSTVHGVLGARRGQFFSAETAEKVFAFIQARAEAIRDAIKDTPKSN
jgi:predicted transcriptional regulator